MRHFLRPESVFFLIALPMLLLIFRERGLSDPGTFWHTRVGEIILADGFMKTDPFTFPFEGKTWIPQQWGGEIIMTKLHRVGGFDAMLLVFLAVFAGAFTIIFRRFLCGGMGWPLAGVVTALAMVAAGFHFYVRPHVFTMVLMIVVTTILVDFDSRRKSTSYLLWLIPAHLVWTNLHGGMLGGIATLGLAGLGWATAFSFKKETPLKSWGDACFVLMIVVVCTGTMFINPIGLELQKTWFRLIGSSTLASHISEHTPLDPSRGGDLAVLGLAVFYFISLLGTLPNKPKHLWFLPLVWFALSMQSIRNGPLFVGVASVILADIWPHTIWFRILRKGGDTLAFEPIPLPAFSFKPWLIPMTIVISGLIIQHFRIMVPLIGHGWARHNLDFVPMDMIDAVQAVPAGSRIYNDPNFGGFLIWYAPNRKIFMDDRFELCGDAWLENYVRVVNEEPQRFDDWQKQYGFQWALIAREPRALAVHLENHKDWIVVKEGKHALLLQRN